MGSSDTAKSGTSSGSDQSNMSSSSGSSTARQSDTTSQPSTSSQSGTTSVVGDSTITAKVKSAIIAEPDLSALDIKVNTDNGVVTLTGSVDNSQKVQKAAQVAQAIDGVKSVNNQLSVKSAS
jgi:hyperosmotically inducible protein